MQLRVGTYSFTVNSVRVQTSRSVEFTGPLQNIPIREKHTLTADGWLYGDGADATAIQLDLTNKTAALRLGLAQRNQDIILYRDDGGMSATFLRSAGSITGIKVVSGPDFDTTPSGNDYANERHFRFVAEAVYPSGYFLGSNVIDFHEHVSISGGLPKFLVKPCINAAPQKQLLYPMTPWVATQSGSAIGWLDYPNPINPLWPDALNGRTIDRDEPQYAGPLAPAPRYTHFPVRWSYQFESPTPLVGIPNRWR